MHILSILFQIAYLILSKLSTISVFNPWEIDLAIDLALPFEISGKQYKLHIVVVMKGVFKSLFNSPTRGKETKVLLNLKECSAGTG